MSVALRRPGQFGWSGSANSGPTAEQLWFSLMEVWGHLMAPASAQRRPLGPTAFGRMARTDQTALLNLIRDGSLKPAELTYAAEAVGLVADAERAVPVLLGLLEHKSALVREGAVYGLASVIDRPGVLDRLRVVAREDESRGVREATNDVLEN